MEWCLAKLSHRVRSLSGEAAFETVIGRADFCSCKIRISAIPGGQMPMTSPQGWVHGVSRKQPPQAVTGLQGV